MSVRLAIVGFGSKLPGQGPGPEGFWPVLRDGVDATADVPADRFDIEALHDPAPKQPGKIVSRRGAFVPGELAAFDAAYFGLAPREAKAMDPQQRMLLEATAHALADAGIPPAELRGSATGVYIGTFNSDYETLGYTGGKQVDLYTVLGGGRYSLANRISFAFDLRGPSMHVDTACSSTATAFHLACEHLRATPGATALVGGCNLLVNPHLNIGLSYSGVLSPSGKCRFGDAGADGYIRGEAIGMIVLKRLDDALKDGNRVYAVVRASGINHDGASNGLLIQPSPVTQVALMREVWAAAGITADDVDYIEAHGTGTRVGDPIELAAFGQALADRTRPEPVYVGSVKTNVGHSEGASALASIMKVAYALKHGVIPPSLHFQAPHPGVAWDELPIRINGEAVPWPRRGRPGLAAMNSFGMTGTNVHLVFEAFEDPREVPAAPAEATYVLPISAKSEPALAAALAAYRGFLPTAAAPADLCHTAGARGTHHPWRVALTGRTTTELLEELERVAPRAAAAPRTAFVYAGQGSAWPGMARELLDADARFAAAIAEVDARWAGFDVGGELRDGSRLGDTLVAQVCIFAVQLGLTRILAHAGVRPEAVVGHSLGEVTAAQVAGLLTLPEALALIAARGEIMRRDVVRGGMVAVPLGETACAARLADPALAIAAVNAPTQCVVSGPAAALDAFIRACEADGLACRRLDVEFAFHSPLLAPFRAELEAKLAALPVRPAGAVAFYSTVTGRPMERLDAAYWAANMCDAVRFQPAVERLAADGFGLAVEVTPHPALAASLAQVAPGLVVVPTLRKAEDPARAMARTLARLYVAGQKLEWAAVNPPGRVVSLPPYPFQATRYWLDPKPAEVAAPAGLAAELDALSRQLDGIRARLAPAQDPHRAWLHELTWVEQARPATAPAEGPWLVFADDDGQVAASLGRPCVWIRSGPGFRALDANRFELDPDDPSGYAELRARFGGATRVLDARPLAAAWRRDHGRHAERLLLALQGLPAAARLWLVTRGAVAVRPEDGAPCLAQAHLVGLARSWALERPDAWGGHVDLGPDGPAGLTAEVAGMADELGVALRGGRRFVPRLVARPELQARPLEASAAGCYLITGGLGHIGQAVAEHLVRAGARDLILASRRGPQDPAAEAATRRFAALGARLHLVAAELGAPGAKAALAGAIAAVGKPLMGIVHGAGTYADRPVAELEPANLAAEWAAKVEGGWQLHELAEGQPLAFFVGLASISGVWGSAGQGPYAAGNAFLDALMAYRRAHGLPGTSIGWGMWAEGGMATPAIAERFARMGILPMAPAAALPALDLAVGAGRSALVVANMDWGRFAAAYQARRACRVFERLGGGSPAPMAAPPAADPIAMLARVLGAPATSLDLDLPFSAMGLDSMMAVELASNLAAAGIQTSIAELLTAPSVRTWLGGRQLEKVIPVAAPPRARVDTWLHTFEPRPNARVRVVAFPYAGGGPAVYQAWPAALDPAVELSAIVLPGRAHRLGEAPFRRMADLVEALAPALIPLFDRPVIFTGHCLGALVMHEVAHWLRANAGVQPAHLLVSGARAPSFYRPEQLEIDVLQFSPVRGVPGHELGEQDFLTFLADLNFGTSAALFDSPEMRKLMLPTVQADLEVNNLFTFEAREPLALPITVVGGRVDPYVTGNHLVGWQALTSGPFEVHMRPGDHYFIETERAFLVELLQRTALTPSAR